MISLRSVFPHLAKPNDRDNREEHRADGADNHYPASLKAKSENVKGCGSHGLTYPPRLARRMVHGVGRGAWRPRRGGCACNMLACVQDTQHPVQIASYALPGGLLTICGACAQHSFVADPCVWLNIHGLILDVTMNRRRGGQYRRTWGGIRGACSGSYSPF